MRKLIVLILMLIIIFFTSIIVVDERQNAVITDYKETKNIRTSGIHFAWPILDKVAYVYINERTALLTLAINESGTSNKPVQLEVLINYHVINPIDYLSAVNKYSKVGISEKIAKILILDVTDILKTESLAEFNRQAVLPVQQSDFTSLGINVDKVSILSIKFIPDENTTTKLNASDIALKREEI